MTFEWDKNKNEINIRKHNVSFEKLRKLFLIKIELYYMMKNIRIKRKDIFVLVKLKIKY